MNKIIKSYDFDFHNLITIQSGTRGDSCGFNNQSVSFFSTLVLKLDWKRSSQIA